MSYAAKSSPQAESDVFEISGSCDALAQLLDIHRSQTEISQERWPVSRALLFGAAVSATMWVGIYWLITLL